MAESSVMAVAVGGRTRGDLPIPLTAFIGRRAEVDALGQLLRTSRLVTATGPGGVGKTRLGVAVAGALAPELTHGVVFVDLVTVTDDTMVVAAVADAAHVPEATGIDRRDALHAALRDRTCLLVVDNCEHLLAGARQCIVELLAACPQVRVLATSRVRLLATGETVFPVPGLSLDAADGHGDAVALFAARIAASGVRDGLTDDDLATARTICERLDGMALAIELAAARVASFGVDGVDRMITQGHGFLAVGHASDERHGSLRAAIDWSYRLLDDDQRDLLRATSVFAAPFDVDAAAAVTGRSVTTLVEALGRLVDWNLISLRAGRPTRYRVLETIRQYAAERSSERAELVELRGRHLAWSASTLSSLAARAPGDEAWCAEVDQLMDDARAALAWAATVPERRAGAAALAALIAAVSFQRGRPAEAQRRYEQAADLVDDAGRRRDLLLRAAGSALTRYVGDDAVDLYRRVAGEARRAGDHDTAAVAIARIVTVQHRHIGTMVEHVTSEQTETLLAEASRLSSGRSDVEAAIVVAAACRSDIPRSLTVARHGVDAARPTGDPLLLDAALDQLCASQLEAADLAGAAETVATRLAALAAVPIDALSGMDHADARLMGAHVDLGLGRFPSARRHADDLAALPFLREERHVGLARRIEVDALAGQFDDVLSAAASFLAGWDRAGRPRVNNFGSAAYAVAMVHGMRDDHAGREEWVGIARDVLRDPSTLDDPSYVWPAVFDGLLLLHRGDTEAASACLAVDPERLPLRVRWYQHLWFTWYAALWAEASILHGVDDLASLVERATRVAGANWVARLVVRRSELLAADATAELPGIATELDRLGCPYQADRTRRLLAPDAPADPAGGALGALSAREREVLELLTAGHTNPEIAGALFISRKTAEHHVSHILAKLGVGTRAEAAAMAARAGPGGPAR
jgi:predicted ATPase/DNA-binding CsgD family transcriptional regulator